ncbi:MAG: HAD-IA family hydrolase [bacterium]|nr:HAD-IA family hydrolase [bacterium]
MSKAILFDVDGTLLDTTDWILQAYLYVAQCQNEPLPRQLVLHEISLGGTLRGTYLKFFPTVPFDELREKHREYQDTHMDIVRAFPGVPETLKTLRENGIKLATMTNRLRDSSLKTMEYGGIKQYFDAFCCADDVVNTKPDPEHVYAALRPLGIEPKDAIVVGDTSADIEAGQRAGARTVAISHGAHADVESLKPDYVIHRIEELLPIVLA